MINKWGALTQVIHCYGKKRWCIIKRREAPSCKQKSMKIREKFQWVIVCLFTQNFRHWNYKSESINQRTVKLTCYILIQLFYPFLRFKKITKINLNKIFFFSPFACKRVVKDYLFPGDVHSPNWQFSFPFFFFRPISNKFLARMKPFTPTRQGHRLGM